MPTHLIVVAIHKAIAATRVHEICEGGDLIGTTISAEPVQRPHLRLVVELERYGEGEHRSLLQCQCGEDAPLVACAAISQACSAMIRLVGDKFNEEDVASKATRRAFYTLEIGTLDVHLERNRWGFQLDVGDKITPRHKPESSGSDCLGLLAQANLVGVYLVPKRGRYAKFYSAVERVNDAMRHGCAHRTFEIPPVFRTNGDNDALRRTGRTDGLLGRRVVGEPTDTLLPVSLPK